ncbi:MAG: protein translocase subunit SecF [Oscillospiraceae bacterium]|nr:protein translocase subunit SecF [Oscillospiraceae bacterium]
MDKSNKSVINNLNKEYKQFSFDFVGKRKIFFIIIGVIFIVGIVSFFMRGFNWDIDFLGGAIMEYNINKDVTDGDLSKVKELVTETIGFEPSSVVKSGSPARQVVIKTKTINTDQRKEIFDVLSQEYTMTEDDIYISNNVDPTVGAELAKNTVIAVSLAVVLMLAYITVRFDFFSGVAAILCLILNMFVMLTFYSLLQIPMNVTVIAAFLTILGYSINAMIVIFDRVRENVKLKKGTGTAFAKIINESACQTLARSINTTITTLLTITCVYILGVSAIRAFALPLIVGIAAGLFTSVCVSGPLWDLIKPDKAKIK